MENPGWNRSMSALRNLIVTETRKILRNPSRLKEALRPRRWRQFLGVLNFYSRTGNRWRTDAHEAAFQKRIYLGYQDYLEHQQTKLRHLDLSRHESDYRRLLRERLAQSGRLKKGAIVLCLGARRGAEVRAFHDHGCFAVGLDLDPGEENPHVLPGDFHAVPFQAESIEVVFTNSLDHVFAVDRFIGEIRRVLKPSGMLIVEAIAGRAEGTAPDAYASFWWDSVDDVVALFEKNGFRLFHRKPFAEPWPGEQLCFEK